MKTKNKVIILVFILIFTVLSFVFIQVNSSLCHNTIIEQLSLQNGYKAILFERDCGATTAKSLQVSILKNSLGKKTGNIFITETSEPIQIRQNERKNLTIIYSPKYTKVYKQEHNLSGINIKYISSQ